MLLQRQRDFQALTPLLDVDRSEAKQAVLGSCSPLQWVVGGGQFNGLRGFVNVRWRREGTWVSLILLPSHFFKYTYLEHND